MDLTYRFRSLLYLIVFILVMSACLAYAAEPGTQPHLLFQASPQHSAFLADATGAPSFDPIALRTAVAPTVTPQTLERVLNQARGRRSLLHRARRTPLQLGPVLQQNESSVVPATPASRSGSARP